MKFLADVGISPRVVEELRQKGHDAAHLLDEGLYRMTDGDSSPRKMCSTYPRS